MKDSDWQGIALFVLILLMASLIGLAVLGSTDVGQKGREVQLGQCYSPEEGLEFCNYIWIKNISYVTVSQGDKEDLLLIVILQTVESHGYMITSGGLSVYVEPAAR